MAAARHGPIVSFIGNKLCPCAAAQIKLPKIVKLVVVVILATKDVERAVLNDARVTSSWLRSTSKGVCCFDFLPRESLYVEGVHVIHSCSVLKATEDDDLVAI